MKIITDRQEKLMASELTKIQSLSKRKGGQINELKGQVDSKDSQIRELMSVTSNNLEMFTERLAELEFTLEDRDWVKLTAEGNKEFSREGLQKINDMARLYWLKNPLIRRAVLTQTYYVFGQGVEIEAEDEDVNKVVQAFLKNPKNRAELTEHQTRMIKEAELQLFANLFFVFFTDISTGKVQIRTIPVNEIQDIITDPEDSKTPLYYKRVYNVREYNAGGNQYTNTEKTLFYPDWKNPNPHRMQGANVAEEVIYHVAVNKLSDMKFGVSEVYAAMDWAKAYKEFLEDWTTIVKAYSRFAWNLTTKGKRGAQGAKDALKTSMGVSSGAETNPSPATASISVNTEGAKLEPIKTAGATTHADDGDKLVHMVCAATGIFYHYLVGDPSTGNLATAKAMERPMELMFKNRQQLWISVFTEILDYVVFQSVKANRGVLQGTIKKDEFGEEIVELGPDKSAIINVKFPDLLEKDTKAHIDAIINAATLSGKTPSGTLELKLVTRMLLMALGEKDIDETIERMYPEDGTTPGEDMMTSAIQELMTQVKKMSKEPIEETK